MIRNEQKSDYRKVEEIHRSAFWNLDVPGCNEHYLAHVLRGHEDFVPELDYVCELDGQVVANVMYTKSKLVDEEGGITEILTFGPIGVKPEFQRRGIGKALLDKSLTEENIIFMSLQLLKSVKRMRKRLISSLNIGKKPFSQVRRNFIFIVIL